MSNFSTKIASTASVVALVATAMSASLVSAASEFLPYAELLADNSVIGVQSNESGYRLGDTVTRAELAKITANLGGYTATECAGTTYGDVGASLGDLCGYIESLAEAGVVSTANANFRPNASVTRAEAVKMLLGAVGETGSAEDAGYTDLANLGDLAAYVNRANELGCAADATFFRPNATSSRGEAFKIAACVAGLEVDTTTPVVPPVNGSGSTTTGSTVAGNVSVTLEGTAVAQYVPLNASNVKVGTVKVTAGTSDVTVNSLTINRSGLGNSSNITIAIGQGGTIISESRSVNSATQDAIVRLNAATTIKAGTTVSFEVLVSVSTDANSQHQFTLKAVGTTAAVTGAPITLGLLNTTSYSVSSVTASTLSAGSPVSGKNDQTVIRAKFMAGTKDVTLNGFTISKTAGATELTKVFTNASVFKSGVKVGTASITSDKIYVTGLATKVARQDTVEFEIRADSVYVGVSTSDTNLAISESTDVSATEDVTGYATATTLSPGVKTGVALTLSALDIVWTKNTTKSVTVAPGTSSVVLFDSKVASSASFDITKFTVTEKVNAADLTDANVAARFSSLTLTVNGSDYDLLPTVDNNGVVTAPNAKGANGVYTFAATADKFRIDAGSPVNVKLVATLTNAVGGALRGYQFETNIVDVKNITNSTTIPGVNKSSGNSDKVTVSAPSITLKAATVSAPSSNKIYSNSSMEIGRFALEAKAEDVTVREITLTNGAVATAVNNLESLISGQNVRLINVDTNAQVSATVALNPTTSATSIKLTGMSVLIPKDTTANFKVVVDTAGDLTTTYAVNKLFNLNVAVVSATSSSSSSLTAPAATLGKQYTVSIIPPTVTLVKKSANIYLVKIVNADSDVDVVVDSLTAQVRPVATNNSSYKGGFCIRTEGSSDKCTGVVALDGTVTASKLIGAIPGTANTFGPAVLGTADATSLNISVSKNSSVTREIFVDSNFVSPTDLQAEITALTYGLTQAAQASETYSVVAQ